MEELLALLRGGMPSSATTTPGLFQRSMEPVMQGRPQYLPELEVTAPAPTPTVAGALRRAQMVDEEADRNPEAARLREEALRQAMARLETLKGSVSDAALSPLLFALGGGATAGQLAENVGSLTGLESVERAGRSVREGAKESLEILGSTGAANAPYVAGAIVANFLPYLGASKLAPWQATGGLTALAGRTLTSAPVDLVQAAQQEGSTAELLGLDRLSESLPGRFAVEALTNVVPDVAMEYALPAIRRGAQAAADVNTDILASRRGAIDLGGGAPEPPRVPEGAAPAPGTPDIVPSETPSVPTAGLETQTVMRPEVDEYFNVPKFGLDDISGEVRLRQTATRLMEQSGFTPKTVVSWDETRKMAEDIGLSVNDIDRKKATRLNGAEMLAIRNLVGANVEQQSSIAARLADGLLPQAEREALENTFKALDVQNMSLLDKFAVGRRQAGRDLNALKIAGNRTNDPTYWLVKAKSILGDERFGMLDAGRRAEIVKLANDGDMTGLYNLLDKERRTPLGKLAKQYYQATLLYNPGTYSVNLTGNMTMAGLETSADAPAAAADYLMSLVTKQRSTAAPTVRQLKASAEGARRGVKEGMQVLRGIPLQEAVQRFEFTEGARTGSVILDAYVNGPFRVLSATDRVFRSAAMRGSLANQAEVLARAEGLKGQALADRAVFLTDNPSDEMITQAIGDAEQAVFQDRTAIGRVLSGIQQTPVVGPLIAPFTQTPGAIATRVFEYSPLGLVYSGGRMAKAMTQAMRGTEIPLAVQRQIVKEVGRGVIGTPLVLAGYWLAKEGKIVPTADRGDRSERDTNRLLGTIEGAVRFDDALLNIARITPAANMLAMGAAIYQKAQEVGSQGPTEFLGSAGGTLLRSVADLPFFTGLEQVQRAVEDPGEFGGAYLRNVARSAMPFSSLLGAAARATDPVMRAPETLGETLMSNIPGLSQQVPGRVNQFGAPLERPLQGFLNQMFLPMGVAENRITDDPVLRAIDESKATLGMPQKAKDETEEQFRARMQEEGPVLRQRIVELIESEEYRRTTSKADRARLIGKVVGRTRSDLTKVRNAEAAREAADAYNAANVGVQIRPEAPRFQPPPVPSFRPGTGGFSPPPLRFQPPR